MLMVAQEQGMDPGGGRNSRRCESTFMTMIKGMAVIEQRASKSLNVLHLCKRLAARMP